MSNSLSRSVSFLVAFTLCFGMIGLQAQEPSPKGVRVMSFNVRYGTANDGENHWTKRREFLVETIRQFDPDLLGTQETLGFQRDYLKEQLPSYGSLGVGRDDGKEEGEMMALYYRKERFERMEEGHFWLSEQPDQVGSKSWDSSLPRMVTWVRLQDRSNENAKSLLFMNTHFDHKGPVARAESAKLIRARIDSLRKDSMVILTGDFNAGADSEPYRNLFGESASKSGLVDVWRSLHPTPMPDEGTFSGFDVEKTKGPRIDWIGVSNDWKVLNADIDRTARSGRTPSDHFPVVAVLQQKVVQKQKDAPKKATKPNPVLLPVKETEGLPRVLLIGDSISMGYTIPVREKLKGKANVLRPLTNCGPTSRGVESIEDWLGKGKWDVIHFNFGLHDMVYFSQDGKERVAPNTAGARHQVPLKDYEANLRTIVARLKKTGAKLIWASTTPVPEGAAGRVSDESKQFNEVAAKIMAENNIVIDDLHAHANAKLDSIQLSKNVHFSPEGSNYLAEKVTESIVEELKRK